MVVKSPASVTCQHEAPVFGCQGCINRDKVAILQQAVGTTKAPPCTTCGCATYYYESDMATMTLYFGCQNGQCDGGAEVEIKR